MKEDDDVGTESAREKVANPGGGGGGGVAGGAKKKKAKNRKKKAATAAVIPKSSEDNLEFDDEVARSVHEVNKILGTSPAVSGTNFNNLSISFRCLTIDS